MKTAVVLGAGFSFVAGLPLTRSLFDATLGLPRAQSPSAAQNHAEVASAYEMWKQRNPTGSAEDWFLELYTLRDDALQEKTQGTTWGKAIRFALSRLVDLPNGKNSHYYFGICSYRSHPVHHKFWRRVEDELKARVVVTLNYDILAEQALHHENEKGRSAPRCYYGGFAHVQAVRKMTNVVKNEADLVQLGNEFVLYKLHGSLNWAWEHHSPTLKIHDDVRAVFRRNEDVGTPAIIPPIPEKEMPAEFAQIWTEARKSLLTCTRWLVCGYSLPSYDVALYQFFAEILANGRQREILVLAPDSQSLAAKWEAIAPPSARIRALPRLPEAFDHVWAVQPGR